MTRGAIIDPDLDQAIRELVLVEKRLSQVERMLADPGKDNYHDLLRMKNERADHLGALRARAERLQIDPRALRVVIREADRLRSKARGREHVSLDKLRAVLERAAEWARQERAERAADLAAAQIDLATVTQRCTGLAGAIDYLEKSRG